MPDDLLAIFNKLCKESHFKPTEAANQALHHLLSDLYDRRDETFGNARLVRNLFEKTIERQANRLAVIATLTDEVLTTILPEDIPTRDTVLPQEALRSPKPTTAAVPEPTQVIPSVQDGVGQLSTLINQALQPQGITAFVALHQRCLQVMFEAEPVPNLDQMIALMNKVLKRMKPGAIAQLRLFGRQPEAELPTWTWEFLIPAENGEMSNLPNHDAK